LPFGRSVGGFPGLPHWYHPFLQAACHGSLPRTNARSPYRDCSFPSRFGTITGSDSLPHLPAKGIEARFTQDLTPSGHVRQ
jgi:hypothetical protein